jgi:predicted RNA binding protein YcfA (HicA-like mRNA interferase family)
MSKPKVLSGRDIVRIFQDFGFTVADQKGSHIKLRREASGVRQTLTIPDHKELDRGTIVGIFRQGVHYIPEADLRPHFYTK